MELPDGFLHVHDGGRHEGGEADEADILPKRGLHDGFRRHVLAEVDDVVAVVFEQDLHDVLSDVVDVALHGREDDAALRLLRAASHGFLHDGEGGLGGFRGHEELREEDGAFFEALTDDVECRHEVLVYDVERVPCEESLTRCVCCRFRHAAFDRFDESRFTGQCTRSATVVCARSPSATGRSRVRARAGDIARRKARGTGTCRAARVTARSA